MTTYVVLVELPVQDPDGDEHSNLIDAYVPQGTLEANNAEQACRRMAEQMVDVRDDLFADGVKLIAVPARNWNSGRHTFRAEIQRKLLRS